MTFQKTDEWYDLEKIKEQFIESNKIQYGIQKGTQASNEYIAIITPYVNQIISLQQQQLKETQSIQPKKWITITNFTIG